MSAEGDRAAGTAAALRMAFDRSFAQARDAGREDDAHDDLLTLRVAGDPYALRLAEISGLHAGRTVVRVPSPAPELLGIAGLRNAMLPIYDLRLLLGYPAEGSPRWTVFTKTSPSVGLAFDQFEGFARVPRTEIAPATEAHGARTHAHAMVALDLMRPIIAIASVLAAIRQVCPPDTQRED
jgi:chemotaxis signal transduction protein